VGQHEASAQHENMNQAVQLASFVHHKEIVVDPGGRRTKR
jgi:hypothetical protein